MLTIKKGEIGFKHLPFFPVLAGIIIISTCIFIKIYFVAVSLSLCVYLFSFYIIYLSTRTLSLITPPYLYYFFYTMYFYIWAVLIFLKEESYSIGEVVIKGEGYDLLFSATVGILSFSLGVLLSSAASRFRPSIELSLFRQKKWIDNLKGTSFSIAMLCLVIVGLSLALIFFSTRGIPILAYDSSLRSSHFFGELAEARIQAQWGAGYFMQGITLILPFCALVLYAKGLVISRRVWKFWAFIITILTIVMMIALSSRGHFAIFLVLLLLLHQLYAKKIDLGKALFIIIIFIVLFLMVSIFRMGYFLKFDDLRDIISSISDIFIYRLSMGTQQFHAILQIFPKDHYFLMGRSYLWDIISFLPGPDLGLNGWLFTLIYPLGIEGSAVTPLSLGEFYVNFGWLGIILGSALLGAFLQKLYIYFIRSEGNMSTLVVFVVITSYLAKSSMNGIGAMIEPILSMSVSYFFLIFVYKLLVIVSHVDSGFGKNR